MNEISNYAMYAMDKKVEGEYKKKRQVMIAIYILIPIAVIVLFSILAAIGPDLTFFAIILIPVYPFLLTKLIKPLTWKWVDISYSGFGKKESQYLIPGEFELNPDLVPLDSHPGCVCMGGYGKYGHYGRYGRYGKYYNDYYYGTGDN